MKIQRKIGEQKFQMTSARHAVVLALAGQLLLTCHANAQTPKPALSAVASNALPSNGQVVAGNAGVSVTGSTMTIHQGSQQAVVNWNSFSVGSSAKVNIVQPDSRAVILNRVIGNDPSQIHGQIQANGQVMLVNPNGVVIGKDGTVSASGFTASSYGITDADFLSGKRHFTRNGTQGGVTNEGSIQVSAGGYVAMIGAEVTNSGRITAPKGTVVLASGETVTVPADVSDAVGVPLSKRVRLSVSASAINAAVTNTAEGVIVAESGQVLLQAAAVADAVATVTHHGRIETSGEQAGSVTLLADRGQLRVDGVIQANSNGSTNGVANKGGDIVIGRDIVSGVVAQAADVSGATLQAKGGFVETSGDYLKTDLVQVSAAHWLLDPLDVEIGTGTNNGTSYINNALLSSTLATGTSVTITTTGTGGNGDIKVTGQITSANNTADSALTLKADRHITIANNILATGSKKLNIELIAGSSGLGGAIVMNNNTKMSSHGGDITLGGGATVNGVAGYAMGLGTTTFKHGISLGSGSVLDATSTLGSGLPSGAISLKGASTDGRGVSMVGSSLKGGSIDVRGQSNKSTGVSVETSILEADASGGVRLTGVAGANSIETGVQVLGSTLQSTASNSIIRLDGTTSGNTTISATYLQGGLINSAGEVEIKANALFEGHGLWMNQGNIVANGRVRIEGFSNSSPINDKGAVGITSDSKISSMNGAISIYGESQNSSGVFLNAVDFKAGTNIDITGIAHRNNFSVSGLRFVNQASLTSGWNNLYGAGSMITLTGNNTALTSAGSTLNTGKGLYVAANLTLSSPGGSVLKSEQGGVYMDYKLNSTNTAPTVTDIKINNLLGDLTMTAGTDALSRANILVMPSAFGLAAPQIMMSGTSKLTMTTLGMGNVSAGRIVNTGSGNVVLGAGVAHLAGDAGGGQVVSVPGNQVLNSGTGELYVYSGSVAATTGLASLNNTLTVLDSSSVGTLNTAFNRSYASAPLTTTSKAQVLFREALNGGANADPVNSGSSRAVVVSGTSLTQSSGGPLSSTTVASSAIASSTSNVASTTTVLTGASSNQTSTTASLSVTDLAKVTSPLIVSGSSTAASSIRLGGTQGLAFNLASAEQLALADCAGDDPLKPRTDMDLSCINPEIDSAIGE